MKELTKLDYSLLMVRILLGATVAAHGGQKLLGWFGGYGFEGTMGFFTGTIGLPYILGVSIILAESIGMIALTFGLLTRFISAALILIMLGAIATVHGQFGFFMNWDGNQNGEGFEFHILVMALAAVTTIHGAGALSLDQLLFRKKFIQEDPYLA
jgi:putative oxidoreductase